MTTEVTTAPPATTSLAASIPLIGMEDYNGSEFRLPRLNIIQTMEQMKDFGGQPGEIHNSLTGENLKLIEGVTVLASKKNRWLGPDFEESKAIRARGEEVIPYCKSSNGNTPDADIAQPKCSACKICPIGTPQRKEGGGWESAACTEIRKVLFKLPDQSFGMLTVRNKAVRDVDAFVQRFYMAKKNFFTVRATLATKEEQGKLNTYYLPVLTPRYDQPVPDEEQLDLSESIALYAEFFAAQAADTHGEESQEPVAGGPTIDTTAQPVAPPFVPPPVAVGAIPSIDEAGF
ncbi:MAG: hypothetical protein PHS14_16395 [Elusimicrobia bacterium]|nr:hypothetical protein [Elusimicrobiota bacterium]